MSPDKMQLVVIDELNYKSEIQDMLGGVFNIEHAHTSDDAKILIATLLKSGNQLVMMIEPFIPGKAGEKRNQKNGRSLLSIFDSCNIPYVIRGTRSFTGGFIKDEIDPVNLSRILKERYNEVYGSD